MMPPKEHDCSNSENASPTSHHLLALEGHVVGGCQLPVGVLQHVIQPQGQLEHWGLRSSQRVFQPLVAMDQTLDSLSGSNVVLISKRKHLSSVWWTGFEQYE